MANDENHLCQFLCFCRGHGSHAEACSHADPRRVQPHYGHRPSSGRILVVDDDPAVRHLISDYFGEHGIQTVSATGRSAAALQLAGEDPSAIILELRLGQGNGLDLLREIRSSSDVPVIILTGRSGDEVDCVVGLELGADDFLTSRSHP